MHIPLTTVLSSSKQSSGFFLAKSGISFKSREKNVSILGFGFNKIREKAKEASQFEALERLCAARTLHQNKNSFIGYSLKMPQKNRVFSPSEVLIGSMLTFGEKSADANGLGCHPDILQAINHAVLELLERHLLSNIWYENGFVSEIRELAEVREDGWHVRFYTSCDFDLPITIAIVTNAEMSVWALGSALRESFFHSIEHAKNEAFMLLESAFLIQGTTYSKDVGTRLSSLKNISYSQTREKFFQSKIKKNKHFDSISRKYSISEMIDKTLGLNPIWIINLFKNVRINAVRVICEFAKNPRWLRNSRSKLVPLDPFC